MAVRRRIPFAHGIFFITLTCSEWHPLFSELDAYDIVYRWFDYLKSKGHFVNAYVIMPNHLHVILSFEEKERSINNEISEGKRFMAYALIKRITEQNRLDLLQKLEAGVKSSEHLRGKRHRVFQPSFDWKWIESDWFMEQKLNYIHANPVRGKSPLVGHVEDYLHCSARFYAGRADFLYPVTHVGSMQDIQFHGRSG